MSSRATARMLQVRIRTAAEYELEKLRDRLVRARKYNLLHRLPFRPPLAEVSADRDPPALDHFGWERKAVCRRCGLVMVDYEPRAPFGQFHHNAQPHQTLAAACENNGSTLSFAIKEIEPFVPKRARRRNRRNRVRA